MDKINKMAFDVQRVRKFLEQNGIVYTVRGYDLKNGLVDINGMIGWRVKFKQIRHKTELANFLRFSGFDSLDEWEKQARRFVKPGVPVFLYCVSLAPSSFKKLDQTSSIKLLHPNSQEFDHASSPSPAFISELRPNEVFVFGSNTNGFHGAGSAGFAMRGTTKNDWRSDQSFLDIVHKRSDDPRGLWAVFGIGRGYQVGKSGSSYAIPTVERPGVQGFVTVEYFRQQLVDFCNFARARPDLRFLVVKLGATRSEGGFSYLGLDAVQSCWKSVHRAIGIPDNVHLPRQQDPRNPTHQTGLALKEGQSKVLK